MPHFPKPWYWKARNSWYVQLDGKQHKLAKEWDEAFVAYQALLAASGKSEDTGDGPKMLLSVLVARFLAWCRANRSEGTTEFYNKYLQGWLGALSPSLQLGEVRPVHLQGWLNRHEDWGSGTKYAAARCAQRVLNWARRQGLIAASPLAGFEKGESGIRERVVSSEEYALLRQEVRQQHLDDVLVFLWHTGCRPQELRALKAEHLDYSTRTMVLERKNSKGKKVRRVVYLDETALTIVERRIAKRGDGFVFLTRCGTQWRNSSLASVFDRLRYALARRQVRDTNYQPSAEDLRVYERQAQVAGAGRKYRSRARRLALDAQAAKLVLPLCATSFRHTFGHRLLVAGIDSLIVARLMGHRSTAMLFRVYGHIDRAGNKLLAELDRVNHTAESRPSP